MLDDGFFYFDGKRDDTLRAFRVECIARGFEPQRTQRVEQRNSLRTSAVDLLSPNVNHEIILCPAGFIGAHVTKLPDTGR